MASEGGAGHGSRAERATASSCCSRSIVPSISWYLEWSTEIRRSYGEYTHRILSLRQRSHGSEPEHRFLRRLHESQLRFEKLQVVAELKAAQIKQSFIYYYYQIYFLSTRDTLEDALSYRKAGNTSNSVTADAIKTIEQTLDSSASLNAARLYDIDLSLIANVSNSEASARIAADSLERLYILGHNSSAEVTDQLAKQAGYVAGPIYYNTTYFMSLTLPVYTNSSVLLSTPNLSGYISVIVNVDSVKDVTETASTDDYAGIYCLKPHNTTGNATLTDTYSYVFGPSDSEYNISSYPPAEAVYIQNKDIGHYTDMRNPFGERVSVGYAKVDLTYADWMISVEQSRGKFMGPTVKLTKLIVGVCIGIAAFMCFVTFPLAHYGVRPILKLQKATEQVTEGRGLRMHRRRKKNGAIFTFDRRDGGRRANKDSTDDSPPPPPGPLSGPAGGQPTYRSKFQSLGNLQRLVTPKDVDKTDHVKTESSDTSDEKLFARELDDEHRHTRDESQFDSVGRTVTSPQSHESFPDWVVGRRVPTPAIVQGKGLFYDELSELTEAFNAMTEELDLQYAHLEDRVRARTKELEVAKIQADTARQQAEAANEAKTVFIANISHELRTPLNGILGMTSVAMAETDVERIHSSLELIFRSGELLLHILTQLLTFSKNQLQRSKLQKRTFQISELASQTESIFGKTAIDQKVRLELVVKPAVLREMVLFADSNRLMQVIMNLVSNSLKFTPEDGVVTVSMRILGEYDAQRSREANYESVFIKNNAAYSSAAAAGSDAASVDTMASGSYRGVLAESYNYGTELRASVDSLTSGLDDDGYLDSQKEKKTYSKFSRPIKWVFELTITDTGPGIDESLQEKIFEAFVQGDQTLSRSYGGTGLGLSICKQFAKMMHGTLTLRSKVGHGSSFTFTIPVPQVGECAYEEPKLKRVSFANESTPVPEMPTVESAYMGKPDLITRASTGTAPSNRKASNSSNVSGGGSSSSSTSPLKVLIAEDNLVNQEVIKRMLKLEGIADVTMACDGIEASELMTEAIDNNETYDLVFMDVQMPNMDGLSATKYFREELKYTGPIVALTAFADQSNKDDCLKVGMSGFMSKPIGRGVLRRILRDFCPTLSPSLGAAEHEKP
ncbi:hypothetical protein KL939_002776 [Ogataea angusta]|nr:hypothetical protein KL939_002776 [Ogataea angusta]